MSAFEYAAERLRRSHSAVEALERALIENPLDRSLLLNLGSARRAHERALAEVTSLTNLNRIALCDYRIIAMVQDRYLLESVSRALLNYQLLFSQIYASVVDGPRERGRVSTISQDQSALSFGYSYAGSLGFVLTAGGEGDLFGGRLDGPIERTIEIAFVDGASGIRNLSAQLGRAVTKRAFEWFKSNVDADFSVDIKWKKSDN